MFFCVFFKDVMCCVSGRCVFLSLVMLVKSGFNFVENFVELCGLSVIRNCFVFVGGLLVVKKDDILVL